MKITPFEMGSYKSRMKFAPAPEFGTEVGEMSSRAGNGMNDFDPANPNARGEGIDEQDISAEITKLRPDAYPLDTIMRNLSAKSSNCTSPEVKYYQQSSKPLSDVIDSSASGSGAGTAAAPVSAYTLTAVGDTQIYVQVTNGEIFRVKDCVLMMGLTVKADDSGKLISTGTNDVTNYNQQFHVTEKSGNVLRLQAVGGMVGTGNNANYFVCPTFDGSDASNPVTLYRCGSAMGEKDMQTEPFGIIPESQTNFCQKYMAQVEETTWQKLWKKEVNYDLSDMEADALYEFRGEIEASYLFGSKYFKDDARAGRTYFCDGITRQIKNHLSYTHGGLTAAEYMGWLKSLYTGNSGSNERILFAGSDLIADIELFQLTAATKNIQLNAVQETYLGVKVTSIVNSFGSLKIVRHPLFDEMGWSAKGLVIDPQFVYKHTFEKMTATNLDFKSSGIKDVDAKVIKETSCLTLRYPDCHAIID